MKALTGCATALIAAAGATAATAQIDEEPARDPRIQQLIVYGNDPCPVSTGEEIIVCARRPEDDRYRLPERFREDPQRRVNISWARQAETLEMATRADVLRCSTVGPGGFAGCWAEMMRQARRNSAINPEGQRVP